LERTREAYVYFRSIPALKRGEIIRQICEALAARHDELDLHALRLPPPRHRARVPSAPTDALWLAGSAGRRPDLLDTWMLLGPLQSRGVHEIFDGAIAELNVAGVQIIFGGSSNSVSSGWLVLMSPLGGIIISLYGCISLLPVSRAIFSNFPFISYFVFA